MNIDWKGSGYMTRKDFAHWFKKNLAYIAVGIVILGLIGNVLFW